MKMILGLGIMAFCWAGSAALAAPTAEQCAALQASIRHTPSPDITYRADPNVVPAEIKSQPDVVQPHDQIKMDIKSTTGLPGTQAKPGREATYGQITIDLGDDGNVRVLLNGRALDDDTRAQMLAACAKK